MKYIRDGIYGYIALTPIEDTILNHPSVLRLHKILQNSTLYHTYPFNRSSRFPHSLGTMHVAGKLLEALFINSSSSDFQKIILAATRFIAPKFKHTDIEKSNTYIYQLQTGVDKNDRGTSIQNDFYVKKGWKVSEKACEQKRPLILNDNYVKNVLYQAVRLAAIVHDIGHLPYSHVLEFSFEELEKRSGSYPESGFSYQMRQLKNAYNDIIKINIPSKEQPRIGKIHERIGLVLIDEIYNEEKKYKLKGEGREGLQNFFDVSFAVCVMLIALAQYGHYLKKPFNIALKQNEDIGYLYPIANIISGPVDCDRLDYLVRDAVNSGTLDFASFDQERIINHVILARLELDHQREKSAESQQSSYNELFVPAFDRRAFSAISDFFYTRYRQFRWIIGHHNVVRTDLAMSRLILILGATLENFSEESDIFHSGEVDDQLKSILEEIGFRKLLELEEPSRRIRYVDDSWLDTILQELFYKLMQLPADEASNEIKRNRRNLKAQEVVRSQTLQTIIKYLQLIIERRADKFPAIWKNEDRFRYFAVGFKKYLATIKEDEIEEISLDTMKKTLQLARLESKEVRSTNLVLKYWWESQSPTTPYSVMLPIEKELNKDDDSIQFALKVFNPYDQVNIVQQNGGQLPLEKISNVVARLKDIVMEGLMLYAFDGSSPPGRWDDEDDIRELGEKVSRILFEKLKELDKSIAVS